MKEKAPKRVNLEFKTCRAMVDAIVTNPNWAREMKMAKTLYGQFPDERFWLDLKETGTYQQLPSLSWLIKNDMKLYTLGTLYEKFQKENIVIEEKKSAVMGEKVGDDYKPTKTVKNLMQFIE